MARWEGEPRKKIAKWSWAGSPKRTDSSASAKTNHWDSEAGHLEGLVVSMTD
jgi:hypothetical protein